MDQGLLRLKLFKTARTGNLDRFKRLALKHAEVQGIEVGKAIGKLVDGGGKRCLHFAADGGSLSVCKYLLETLKLDVDSKNERGYTPLCHAITNGHLDTVKYLLEKGANADDDTNHTPLQCAASTGDTKIIAPLLSKGVHLDVATKFGTALDIAAGSGHQDAVKLLLDHGANPNVASQGMLRPLILAIYVKSWESVELLLQAGADPNAVSCGNTPLVAAARNERADIVTRLLEAGADPNYKMNAGLTALEMAALFCNYQNIEVLFPVTSRIPTYPDWSIAGLLRYVYSDANKLQVTEREGFARCTFEKRLHQSDVAVMPVLCQAEAPPFNPLLATLKPCDNTGPVNKDSLEKVFP